MTASADSERNGTMASTNTVVANAMAARTARNGVSAVERKASALKQAISWMEQNAKAW